MLGAARLPRAVRRRLMESLIRLSGDRLGFRFTHRTSDYATHQPVLYRIVAMTDGPILELGCGRGSTPLLHRFARGRQIVSVDNDPHWLRLFRARYEGAGHRFVLTDDWDRTLGDGTLDGEWSVVFIDQSPWEARYRSLMRLRDRAEYIVLHDADYFPAHDIFGTQLRPITPFVDPGRRDYGDVFEHWTEFFPDKPWPAATGPPTLLGSNVRRCDVDVSFDVEHVLAPRVRP
jgi:hypothetical protein